MPVLVRTEARKSGASSGHKLPLGGGSRDIHAFLDRKVEEYNRPSFIESDPIGIPHRYSHKQDIEIAGFFSAIFSWGNRQTIIRKSLELMRLMDDTPHQFILHHSERDLGKLLDFKHRTFNSTDLLYFIAFLRHHYHAYDSLEDAFLPHRLLQPALPPPLAGSVLEGHPPMREVNMRQAFSGFHEYFFSLEEAPPRTRKHIATPAGNSSCKRLNMFLRWMVRKDDKGVDFGIWERFPASRLICPLDVHVARVARRFGLLSRPQTDWQAAVELTDSLRALDKNDPVKYDFALFGLGIMEKF